MKDKSSQAIDAVRDAKTIPELLYAFNVATGRATAGVQNFTLKITRKDPSLDLAIGVNNGTEYGVPLRQVAAIESMIRTGLCEYIFNANGDGKNDMIYAMLHDGRVALLHASRDNFSIPEDQAAFAARMERLIRDKKHTHATAIYGELPKLAANSLDKVATDKLRELLTTTREEIDPDLSPEEINKLFSSPINTPIGVVVFGRNQGSKLDDKDRTKFAGWIRPTLTDPLMIVQEPSTRTDGQPGERSYSNVFVKAVGKPGGKGYGFVCVGVQIDTREVVITNHIKRPKQLLDLMKHGRVVYRKPDTQDAPAEMLEAWVEEGNRIAPLGLRTGRPATSAPDTRSLYGDLTITSFFDGLNEVSMAGIAASFEQARQAVNQDPTPAQKESGNYAKGHVTWQGLQLALENPRGSIRRGVDENGKAWETMMPFDYGYIKRTEGADSDHLDCFVGNAYDQQTVYIINQVNPATGAFDEHKIMLAFPGQDAAHDAYLASYEAGWNGLGSIHSVGMDDFMAWMDGDTKQPYAPAPFLESATSRELIFSGIDFVQISDDEFDHGRVSYVTTVKGLEVRTAFKLVDASSLVVSNTPDGRINDAYPQELQPRDRTRAASIMQIDKLSKTLRPVQLADSGLSSHGAPIIGPDMAVESGNGRTMAIIKAYADGNADDYRQYLLDNADLYGMTREQVEQMAKPVLVRARLDDVDRVQFAKDSNVSDLQSMSPTEQARVDAEVIDERMLALFSPSDSGDLLATSNRPFIQAFLGSMASEQAAGLMTADGRPTKQVVDRVQAAIFAKAYQNEQLLTLAVEEPDPEIRNILTALNSAAPDFIQMKYLSGEAHKQASDAMAGGAMLTKTLDEQALSALVDATTVVRQAKASGQDIDEYLSQQGLFGDVEPHAAALAKFIASNNRSSKRMAEAFKAMASEINAELAHQGAAAGDMFGAEPMDLFQVLARVSDRLTEQYGEKGAIQTGMFEALGWRAQARVVQAVRSVQAAPDMPALLTLLEYSQAGMEKQYDPELLDKMLSGPILALRDADNEDDMSDASDQFRSIMDSISSKSVGPIKYDLDGAVKADWFPGATGFDASRWMLDASYAAQMKQLLLAARRIRQDEPHDMASQLESLQSMFAATTLTPSRRNLLDWMMKGKLPADFMVTEFAPFDIGTFQNDQDQLEQQIRALDIDVNEGGNAAQVAAMADICSVDTLRRLVAGEKGGDRIPDELLHALNERLMAHLKEIVDNPDANTGKLVVSAYQDWYNNNWMKVKMDSADLAKLATQLSRATNAQFRKVAEPSGEGIDSLVAMVDDAIAGGLSDMEMANMTAKTNIKITAVRLAKGYTMDQLKADMGTFFKLTAGQGMIPTIVYKDKRASASDDGTLNSGCQLEKRNLWHEMGHHVEFANPELLALARAFLVRRAATIPQGQPQIERLQVIAPNGGYGKKEMALNAKFSDPYVGRIYDGRQPDTVTATEVWSMGFQALSNPGFIAQLAKKDPEHLAMTLTGLKLLKKKQGDKS